MRLGREDRTRSVLWTVALGIGVGLTLAVLLREPAKADGVDLVALQNRVLELTGDARVEVRHLGDGIIELVGDIDAPMQAKNLVEALSDQPGVLVVLDRLWGSAR